MMDFVNFESLAFDDGIGLKLLDRVRFEVFKNYHLFDEFTIRQEYAGTAHNATKTIPLRLGKSLTPQTTLKDLTEHSMLDEMEFADWDNMNKFPLVKSMIDSLMWSLMLKELGWLTIVSLQPEGVVHEHIDEGEYCKAFHRFHICIYGPYCTTIIVDRNEYDVNVGDVFTFNNKVLHSAKNESKTMERINIIFDAR